MYILDIETFGTESTSVVLSAAMVYFEEGVSYQELIDSSIFVKFDAKEQIQKYGRITDKNTLEWWAKQSTGSKQISLIPSENDLTASEGILQLKQYLDKSQEKNKIVFTRGNLDPMCMESLCKAVGVPPIIPYYNYMDIRTALNLLKTTTVRGYCDVSFEGFNIEEAKSNKHDPIVDVCLDAMMIMYGI
jgi:3' exoribonuclease, RNase T-like